MSNRRRSNMVKAVSGVTLAGGALVAIFYWNHFGGRGGAQEARASMPVGESQTAVARAEPVTVAQAEGGKASAPATMPSGASGVGGGAVLVQGKSLAAQGKLVEARAFLNDALIAGTFSGDDLAAAKVAIRDINGTLLFSPTRVAGDEFVDNVTIKKGDLLTKIANDHVVPYELLLRINGLADARKLRLGQNLKVIKGPFHAVVDKKAFTLDLYLGEPGGAGSMYVTTYRVGLGTDNSTPAGLWKVTPENKLKNPTYYSPRGEGIIQPGDPKNPLGPYWIGLTGVEGQAAGKTSYGIHGTIHPESVGTMSSMGCIRLVNEDVAQVFLMLYEGKSTVRVVE